MCSGKRSAGILEEKNFYLEHYLKAETLDGGSRSSSTAPMPDGWRRYVTDISVMLIGRMKAGRHVLFEGAQGTHLDIDHGTYPYVTSSNTVAGSACCGGRASVPGAISGVVGIVKAYTTRVGKGPSPPNFSTRSATGCNPKGPSSAPRPAATAAAAGWMRSSLRNAVRLNGLTGLAITKLDVLGGLDEIKICDGYAYEGRDLANFPGASRCWRNAGRSTRRCRDGRRISAPSAPGGPAAGRPPIPGTDRNPDGDADGDHLGRPGPRRNDRG